MPFMVDPTDVEVPVGCDDQVYDVLLTGCGPSPQYHENPSWLAVRSLRNKVLIVHPSEIEAASSLDLSTLTTNGHILPPLPSDEKPRTRYIRISTLCVPLEYEAILDIIPDLHSRPPMLPEYDYDVEPANPPPPADGYDFIFHVGVAGRGGLRVEKLAHKLGYNMKDVKGKHAPEVKSISGDFEYELAGGAGPRGHHPPGSPLSDTSDGIDMQIGPVQHAGLSAALNHGPSYALGPPEMSNGLSSMHGIVERPTRGCRGFEKQTDELHTDVDLSALVAEMKRQDITHIYSSMDAGHYLCDFIYYCSLASAIQHRIKHDIRHPSAIQLSRLFDAQGQGRHHEQTPVLCMHCPPVGKPLQTEEVTDAIKKILKWVVGGLPSPSTHGP